MFVSVAYLNPIVGIPIPPTDCCRRRQLASHTGFAWSWLWSAVTRFGLSPSAGVVFMTNIDQSLRQTVASNADDYRGFPEPGTEWRFAEIDVPFDAFFKAHHNGWVEEVGEHRPDTRRGPTKVWRTTELLWTAIEQSHGG